MRWASIDPGKVSGVAIWEDDILQHASVADPDAIAILGLEELVIEMPFIYPRGKRNHKTGVDRAINPNDIVRLALCVGRITGVATTISDPKIVYYKPFDWKHQLPKDVHHERIKRALSEVELARCELPKAKKAQLDLWDAVGLGQFHVQQLRIARRL